MRLVALGGEMDLRVEVRPLHAGGDLLRHPLRDAVAALRAVQRETGDPVTRLIGEGRRLLQGSAHPLHDHRLALAAGDAHRLQADLMVVGLAYRHTQC